MASTKPLIVVIPGGFQPTSAYDKFKNGIQERGFEAIVPALRTSGSDNIDATLDHRADARGVQDAMLPHLDAGREAIVISHSYSGLPAPEAIYGQTVEQRAARGLKGGVVAYIATAAMSYPLRGKSFAGDDTVFQPLPYHEVKDGVASLKPEVIPIMFGGLSDEEADAAYKANLKQSFAAFQSFPDYVTRDLQVPTTFILTEQDASIPPQWQEGMANDCGFESIVRVQSGHAPFHQIPEKLVEIVEGVAASLK